MVIWIVGLSGAGKTTLGKQVVTQAKSHGIKNVILLDGDQVRQTFGNDLGHTLSDRKKNADRLCCLSKFINDEGIHVICPVLSLFEESRKWNRQNIKDYYEVYIEAPMEELIKRDSKGIYKQASKGELQNVAGIDLVFIPPSSPDLIIHNSQDIDELLKHAQSLASLLLHADRAFAT